MLDHHPAHLTSECSPVWISVVIPTRGRADALGRCLESLAAQTDGHFEVVVVCDGEDTQTREISKSFKIRVPIHWCFLPESVGLAGARNLGAERATGELLLFMDDDATAKPGWITAHRIPHVAAGASALLAIGRVVHVYDRPPRSHTERFEREQRWQPDERYASSVRDLDLRSGQNLEGYCGFNCSLRRELFLGFGGYDVAMRPVDEEMELAHRLYRKGVETVVALDATLYHHDTKDLIAYNRSAVEHSGRLDVYRILTKQQRSTHITALRCLQSRNPLRRLGILAAWYCSKAMGIAAAFWRRATDQTGSRWCFRRWRSMEMPAAYWRGVRSAGIQLDKLEAVAPNPWPVLALHGLMRELNEHERRYHLSPGSFLRLIEALRRLGYRSVSAGEGLTDPARQRYLLTFDDGYENLHTELLPYIEPYSLKPLVFLVADHLGGVNTWDFPRGARPQKLLSIQQIREMQRRGVEFGSHTCSHPWLPSLSGKDLDRELCDSRRKLEDVLGAEVACFAYPYGGANSSVRAAVARAGYKRAFSIQPGLSLWDDPYFIRRIEVRESEPFLASLFAVLTGTPVWRDTKARAHEILRTGAGHLPESIAEGLRRAKKGFDAPY